MHERRATLGLAPALPGLMLVIIIFWALAAVLMLTGTLINAREIQDDVVEINDQIVPIDDDLDNVKLAAKTVELSGQIDAAAKPLSSQAGQIIAAARSIDKKAKSILATAGSINRTAKVINNSVTTINASVSQINSRVVSIAGQVDSIGGSVASIGGNVDLIGGRVGTIGARVRSIARGVGSLNARDTSINAAVERIFTTFQRLEPVVVRIDRTGRLGGVAGINRRAAAGIRREGPLKDDFEGIISNVGFGLRGTAPDHGTGADAGIHGHANSIDCAPLINSAGPTQYCNR